MDEKSRKILQEYKKSVVNFREALRLAGMPETLILFNTLNLPDLSMMMPDDVVKFYQEVKTMIILYLDDLGFSRREIARRIGGDSMMVVNNILKKYKPKSNIVSSEEVTSSEK